MNTAFLMHPRNDPPDWKKLVVLSITLWGVTWLALILTDIPVLVINPSDGPGYPANPSYAMVDTMATLVETGRLESEKYSVLHEHFLELSRRDPGQIYTQDLYALGRTGEWLPKHPWLPVALGAPFYWVGGEAGMLACIALIFSAAIVWTALLTYQWAGQSWRSGVFATLLLLLISFPFWASSLLMFSYDLLSTVFVLAGIWLAPRHPVRAGLFVAMAFGFRATNVFFIALVACLFLPWTGWKRSATPFFISAGLVVSVVIAINLYLYGHWGGGYGTAPIYSNGEMVESFSRHQFHWNIFFEKGAGRLIWWKESMLRHYPGLLLALPLCLLGLFRPGAGGIDLRAMLIFTSLAGFCLLFASFSYWELSGGYRFVMLPALLWIAMAGAVVARLRSEPT